MTMPTATSKLTVLKYMLVRHIAPGFKCRKMGIKTRPLLDEIAERLSGDPQFKLAHEKLLAVEQRHKQLVQEIGMHRRYGELVIKETFVTQGCMHISTGDFTLNCGNQHIMATHTY